MLFDLFAAVPFDDTGDGLIPVLEAVPMEEVHKYLATASDDYDYLMKTHEEPLSVLKGGAHVHS